jgi:signal transduction histidine kinase
VREQVFLPFRRLHDAPSAFARAEGKGGGAGLGLALVRQIARFHGADAVVAARPARRAASS